MKITENLIQVKRYYPVLFIYYYDLKNQVFTIKDSEKLKSFVDKADYVTYLGYWSMERELPGVVPNTTVDAAGCPVGLANAKHSGISVLAGAYLDALRF